jgi:hypothetical protein
MTAADRPWWETPPVDDPPQVQPAPGRRETPEERLDRNLEELLAGLRVALPGVQVLFAFLLVLPFQQRFEAVTSFQEKVYFATLLATALATALLIAPSARHRIQFRRADKEWVVVTANRLAIAGLATLGVAMSGAILLVSDFLFASTTAAIATTAVLATIGGLWFVIPLARRLRGH